MDESFLIITEEDDSINLNTNIDQISIEISKCKHEIDLYININNDIDLTKKLVEGHILNDKTCDLINDIHIFENYTKDEVIHNISHTTFELQKLLDDLENVNYRLKIFEQIIEFNKNIKNYEEKKNIDLNEAVLTLSSITELLNKPLDSIEDLLLFKNIQEYVTLNWEKLLDELSRLWMNILNYTASSNEVIIRIFNNKNENKLLEALISSNQIYIEMKKFSQFLLNEIFDRLIHTSATIEVIPEISNNLHIVFSNKKSKPYYEDVLNNLKIVFEYLYINLNYSDINILHIIGDFISSQFSDVLIKDCLVDTIPNCISELQDYGKVTSQVEIFQKYLSNINFFESECVSILQYANNIDVLFANKTSQYFLENARNIMKKDLGISMSVGCEFRSDNLEIKNLNLNALDKELINYFFQSFHTSPFKFPRCAISRSIQELLDLIILMMEQAIEASDLCARRLYYSARNVFELYIAITPLIHKQFLDTMPQQIALFHNNCMYLAHHLLTLSTKWQKNWMGRELNYSIIFCDQIKELRDLGTHLLLDHMRYQKKQILDTIKSSDLYYIAIKDTLSENAGQAIRQCIRQLQVLNTVWSGILPNDVYRRIITCLANVFIEELISKVIAQEDITADVATQLTDLYKIVLNHLPQIYNKDDIIIHKNITSWLKFNELILVLGGNLASIEERWFNGSGPLAMEFKPDEIKRLIRALFQNTTFRANLLSKIK